MISKIDITIFLLERICGEILDVINGRKEIDDITDLVKNCIIINKEKVCLERYSLYVDKAYEVGLEFRLDFSVKFFFRDFPDSLTVGFHEESGSYKAHLLNEHIIVTQPVSLFKNDIMYCSPFNKILYVDDFTKWIPIDDDDRRLSIDELQDGKRLDFDSEKKENFISFYNRVTGKEREDLLLANVGLHSGDDAESENYKFLRGLISSEVISTVVTSDEESYAVLRNLLPADIVIYRYDERIRPLAKRQWFSCAIRKLIGLDWHYSGVDKCHWKAQAPMSDAFNKWVANLVKYHQIPYSMVYDVCFFNYKYDFPFLYHDCQALLNEIRGINRIYSE